MLHYIQVGTLLSVTQFRVKKVTPGSFSLETAFSKTDAAPTGVFACGVVRAN